MNILELFNQALNKPHADLCDRLEFGRDNRIFVSGFYAEGMVSLLTEKNITAKIFTTEKIPAGDTRRDIVQLTGCMTDKIAAFPDNTFNIAAHLWPQEWESIVPVLSESRRISKPGGQTSVLVMKDSTPTPVMPVLKRFLLKEFHGRLHFGAQHCPESTKTVRKAFDKAGFVNSRVWENSFAFDIEGADLREYSEVLLAQLLPSDDKCLDRKKLHNDFLTELASSCANGVLHITYEYLGGIGYK